MKRLIMTILAALALLTATAPSAGALDHYYDPHGNLDAVYISTVNGVTTLNVSGWRLEKESWDLGGNTKPPLHVWMSGGTSGPVFIAGYGAQHSGPQSCSNYRGDVEAAFPGYGFYNGCVRAIQNATLNAKCAEGTSFTVDVWALNWRWQSQTWDGQPVLIGSGTVSC